MALSIFPGRRLRTSFPQFLHLTDTQTKTNAFKSVVEAHQSVVRVSVDKEATTTFTAENSLYLPIKDNDNKIYTLI